MLHATQRTTSADYNSFGPNYIIYIGVETFDLIYTKEEEKKIKS